MNCSQIKKKLSAFMDNELDSSMSRFIEEHLKACPRCRGYLYELNEIDDLVYGLPRNDPSPDFLQRVVKAAFGTSKIVDAKPVPFSSRLRFALERLSDEIFGLIPSGRHQRIRTLEEFGDCPPLSMSFIYFRLLEQPQQRMLT
jgi:anti-sigma factor RsiW